MPYTINQCTDTPAKRVRIDGENNVEKIIVHLDEECEFTSDEIADILTAAANDIRNA